MSEGGEARNHEEWWQDFKQRWDAAHPEARNHEAEVEAEIDRALADNGWKLDGVIVKVLARRIAARHGAARSPQGEGHGPLFDPLGDDAADDLFGPQSEAQNHEAEVERLREMIQRAHEALDETRQERDEARCASSARRGVPDNEPSGKCWIISSGSYSDYTVHAVFLSKEDADAFCARDDVWYDVEERPLFVEGEQPESCTWYSGSMDVNMTDPVITVHTEWPWEWRPSLPDNMRPSVRFLGYNRTPGFVGEGWERGMLERALREKTLKYRAQLDQTMRDVIGTLRRLAGDPPRPVMVQEIAMVTGIDVTEVAWAVQEMQRAGLAEDAPRTRPVSHEEMEAPEPTEGKVARIPIRAGIRPPKPTVSGDVEGTDAA